MIIWVSKCILDKKVTQWRAQPCIRADPLHVPASSFKVLHLFIQRATRRDIFIINKMERTCT
jgi:hypothetical protein